ncbi:uncharacterized protein LOC26536095 [Drosophila yakuba]|uniref:Seminal fluid protein n=1 Tax=Drosophila yakuba TaxID=7245 RepID=A0A0R1DL63_DROYA|nr:uncharacterized protein LOC26536095 [Drosophila yakuba]KRJ98069.1 uncharacterized protein Dyak_GE28914 [Drosophila yakuba]
MMAWLKWITILQVLIIFSAIQVAEFQELSDVLKKKYYNAVSNAGSTIKSASVTLESVKDVVDNVFKMKKGAAQRLVDLFSFRSSEPQKNSSAASSSSCAREDIRCEIEGVFGSGSIQQPVQPLT